MIEIQQAHSICVSPLQSGNACFITRCLYMYVCDVLWRCVSISFKIFPKQSLHLIESRDGIKQPCDLVFFLFFIIVHTILFIYPSTYPFKSIYISIVTFSCLSIHIPVSLSFSSFISLHSEPAPLPLRPGAWRCKCSSSPACVGSSWYMQRWFIFSRFWEVSWKANRESREEDEPNPQVWNRTCAASVVFCSVHLLYHTSRCTKKGVRRKSWNVLKKATLLFIK